MGVKICTMGGTIDKVYFDELSRYEVGEPQVGEILREAEVNFEFTVEEVARKDSLHLTTEDRDRLRERIGATPEQRVLVTHGTDTMVETARHLLPVEHKVIVLTGALVPARFKASDAPFNVGCAVGALQALPPGVYVVMNGCIFRADNVRKNREAGRFEELVPSDQGKGVQNRRP